MSTATQRPQRFVGMPASSWSCTEPQPGAYAVLTGPERSLDLRPGHEQRVLFSGRDLVASG